MNEDIINDEVKIEEEEISQLKSYIEDKNERLKAKQELKSQNQMLSELSKNKDEKDMFRLDSSIKKCTAFIKRLKNLTENQKEALSKEMSQLNLSKYLSEVAAAFTEAKLKMNDIPCALHLCSKMQQNYAEFETFLLEQWQKVLNSKKDEKSNNLSKLR